MAFSNAGQEIIGFDLDVRRVELINSGVSPVEDISNSILSNAISSGNYRATDNPKDLSQSDVVIIAVPTPLDFKREPDLKYLISASEIIGKNLRKPSLIINESTSYPGTLRNVIWPAIELNSGKKGMNHYAISPERVDPGNKSWDMKNTPRLYAGLCGEASRHTREVYSLICDNLIEVSSPEVAEAAKLFENTFRQVNIALVNELAEITSAMNIPVREVLDAAASKPYGFMKFSPGLGVGGHCIPVDPSYLAFVAEKNGVPARFINLANKVNLEIPKYVMSRVVDDLGTPLRDLKVLVCGLSYKPNISDVRESPSEALIKILREEGAFVHWHDENVKIWNNEKSVDLPGKYDAVIVAVRHANLNVEEIMNSSDYIFDCTGTIEKAKQL